MGEAKRRGHEPFEPSEPPWKYTYIEEVDMDAWGWHHKDENRAYLVLHSAIDDSWGASCRTGHKTTMLPERFVGLDAGKAICERDNERKKEMKNDN